jgi:riboflavin kinase/FMN adenylyltransferase
MKTVFFDSSTALEGRYAATIGFFDGVHLGHRYLIQRLRSEAALRGLQTMAVTFEHHPRQVLQPEWQPQLLTTLNEKAAFLSETGIDMLVVLRFDRSMANLSAHDFMSLILHDRLHAHVLLTGYDNRFGHDRSEGFADYVRYGRELGIEVLAGDALRIDDCQVSSSVIRRLLSSGRVSEAARCLGRNYSLSGCVIHGQAIGRTLGFPTANVQPADYCRLIPASGVYAVTVTVDGSLHPYAGVMNIGTRPTFAGQQQTLEVNILDFTDNLYDRQLTVSFVSRLRDEQHFPTTEALVCQMHRDVEQVRKMINENKYLNNCHV